MQAMRCECARSVGQDKSHRRECQDWTERSVLDGGGVDHCLARSESAQVRHAKGPLAKRANRPVSSLAIRTLFPFRVGAEILSPSSGTAFTFDRRKAHCGRSVRDDESGRNGARRFQRDIEGLSLWFALFEAEVVGSEGVGSQATVVRGCRLISIYSLVDLHRLDQRYCS